MTKIYYSPYYTVHTYRGLSDENNILLDEMVVDNGGLIGHLQLVLGLHHESVSSLERLTAYYTELKRWMEAHPENELAEPFKVSGLDVARKCLEWRDELSLCGWSKEHAATSDRMKALQGVEHTFDSWGFAESVKEVLGALRESASDSCADIILAMPCDVDLLHPVMQNVVNAMVEHSAKVEKNDPQEIAFRVDESLLNDPNNDGLPGKKSNLTRLSELLASDSKEKITLDKKDESLLIYDFKDEREAAQYMAVMAGRLPYVLWINANNKATDNWLRQMGKPTIGSSTPNTVPQVAQLLVLGIGLFARPLNIHTLLDWLQPDLHPLGERFRHVLSDTIASEGGYNNDKCRKVISDYIDGVYSKADEKDAQLTEEELEKKKAKERKEREELLRIYLPIADDALQDGVVSVDRIRKFVTQMELWAKRRAPLLTEEEHLWAAQLHSLAQMAHAMKLLLEDANTETVSHSQVANWAGSLLRSEEYLQYAAERGSQFTISSPGSMVATTTDTIWWNVEDDDSPALCCDFLMPSERRALQEELTFWNPDKENKLRQLALLTPFTHTNFMLTLTRCKTRGGEPTQKHPLLVRIENQVSNWEDFVRRPNLNDESWEPVERTCNESGKTEIIFQETDKVKWSDHLSVTTMDTLIQWPLDYVMERFLGLKEKGPGVLPDLLATKGNVPHAVIEYLFGPREENEKPSAAIIRERMDNEYDDTYRRMVEARGAILHLPENQLENQLLKEQLKLSLQHLLEIIETNRLRVTACERFVKGHLGVLASDKETHDVSGYIDMTLEDENHHPVVFDFKWTSSRKYYQGLLSKNESIQLQLYRRMLGAECNDEVQRAGYFLMPEARLYSTEAFEGNHCVQVKCENNDVLLEKVRRSIEYRRQQIAQGIIENGDGHQIEALSYATDEGAEERVPLKAYEEGVHDMNKFSKYNLFKR